MFNITDPNSAILVELTSSDRTQVLMLAPHEEWAFVVGSAARADFHIDRVGVAPVQFHLERSTDGVWLIPAYGIRDLRVNANRVLGPTPLDERNVIEFCGVRLEAAIHDGDGFAANSDTFPTCELDIGHLRSSYSLELPGDADTTQLAMPAVSVPSGIADQPPTFGPEPVQVDEDGSTPEQTRRMPRYQSSADTTVDSPAPLERTTQRLVPFRSPPARTDSPDYTLNGTQIMAPYRPAGSTQAEPSIRPLEPLGTVPTSANWVPPKTQPAHYEQHRVEPKHIVAERPQACSVSSPPSGSAPNWRDQTRLIPQNGARLESASVQAQLKPVAQTPVSTAWLVWLAKLGLLTKARPILVIAGAALGACALIVLLVTATRLIESHRSPAGAPAAVTSR